MSDSGGSADQTGLSKACAEREASGRQAGGQGWGLFGKTPDVPNPGEMTLVIQPPVASARWFGKKLRLRRKVDRHFTTIAYLTGKWFIIWWFRTPSSGRKPDQTLLIFDYTAPVSAAAA
ncbi:MAG: hypothetical protein VXZ63_14065, partial [Planctomycetota bacterium]|nr:hypothetical protein [Planctomycetota bacterium]